MRKAWLYGTGIALLATASYADWDTSHATAPTNRSEVGSVTVDGVIYSCGGFDLAAQPVATCETYDVGSDTWDTAMASKPG